MKHSTAAIIMLILILAILTPTLGQHHHHQEQQPTLGHALFVKTSDLSRSAHSRAQRAAPASPADVMAQNILEWIQGIYTRQGTRKTRQQSDSKAYLPPHGTQRPPEKPRPFGPSNNSQLPGYTSFSQNEVTSGYPFQRPSSYYTPPNVGYPSGVASQADNTERPSQQSSTYIPPSSYNPPGPTQSPSSYPEGASFPPIGSAPGSSGSTTVYLPPQNTAYPNTTPRYPSPSGFTNGYPVDNPTPGFPTPEAGETNDSGQSANGYPSTPGPQPPFTTPGPGMPEASSNNDEVNTSGTTSAASATGGGETTIGGSAATGATSEDTGPNQDDDLNHPPHIHSIDVECSKTMMTINIEFNRVFNGVIYSKGYFMNPDCRYVEQNSEKNQYSFTVSLDSCGTQFINDFEGEAGQAYLENVLVLQNEPGIQEVWDTVRRVRCLWEGNINKALSVSLSVDMLNQEIVTFSGDTATAKLDIQIGKGPFAPAADGLVKIGEIMTLVVSVEGDPGFDLQVRDCVARDELSTSVVQLTDERGCILKPKLFGAFQKTTETGNTGASIIAYAFFQAFKFPDIMDLFIECNVELCKTDCEPCPDANQQIEPGRRRRSVASYAPSNKSTSAVLLSDPIRVRRGFKVIMLDDLSTASSQLLESMEETAVQDFTRVGSVCMSNSGFYTAFSLLLCTLVATVISTAILYFKLRRIYRAKMINL